MSLKAKLVRGSIINLLDHVLKIAVIFITTPLMIEKLGEHNYGIWLVALTIIGYLRLLDLGLSFTGSRFLSQAVGSDNANDFDKHQTNLCFLFSRIAVVSLVLTFAITALPAILPRALPDLNEAKWILFSLGIATSVRFLTAIYTVILKSHLRYDLLGYSSIARTAIQGVVVATLLLMGFSLPALAIAYIVTDLLDQLIVLLFAKGVHTRPINLFPSKCYDLRPMLRYGTTAMLATVGHQLRTGIDPLIIGKVLGIASVPAFSLGTRFLHLFTDVINSLFGGNLLAAFSQLDGRNDAASLAKAFLDSTRLCTAIAVAGGGALFLFTPSFIHLWIGPAFAVSGTVSSILTIPTALMLAQYPASSLLFSKDQHNWMTFIAIGGGALNAILSVVLVFKTGILGPAIATAVELILFQGVLIAILAAKITSVPLPKYLFAMLRNALPYLTVALLISPLLPAPSDYNYKTFFFYTGAYAIASTCAFLIFTIDASERNSILRTIRAFK